MTGTNSPNYYNTSVLLAGVFHERLIFVVFCVHYAVFDTPRRVCVVDGHMFVCVLSGWLCRWLIAAGKRPVPFRTRKLSLRRADGTALGRVWESRLLPTLYNFMFLFVWPVVGCTVVVCLVHGPQTYPQLDS